MVPKTSEQSIPKAAVLSTAEENKLHIDAKPDFERMKHELEIAKAGLAVKSYRMDWWAKVALPLASLILAATVLWANTRQNAVLQDQTAHQSQTEFQYRDVELHLKLAEAERAREASKSKFLQDNIDLIMSHAPTSETKLAALANTLWSGADADEVLRKARIIRLSLPVEEPIEPPTLPSVTVDYVSIGKGFVAANDFEKARINFDEAVRHEPESAIVWNYKAYAEMQTDHGREALASIKTAIDRKPTVPSEQKIIMINAAKILCSLGRTNDAVSYINQAIHNVPAILEMLRKDGEFKRRCGSVTLG